MVRAGPHHDSQVTALIDAGNSLSCTAETAVPGIRISRERLAEIYGADGHPVRDVRGEANIQIRFRNSERIFTVPMQVANTNIPFTLGRDFLAKHGVSINFAASELLFPPAGGHPAATVRIRTSGASDHDDQLDG